ncbi:NaCP60E [Symbiodinium natans]|uniref:NaCP60E protein n=1 Tax=Symbiodinium natans TaxID=878477 RepID=A0A812KUE1_9DINO|nr:NaCP60E [Symbiodinium natans]
MEGALDADGVVHGFQRLPDVRTVKPREPHIDNDDVPAILVIRHAEPTEPTESCSARTSLLFPEDGGPEQYLSQEFRRLLEELLQQHMREVSRVELELEALRRTGPAPDTEVGKEASWEASWDRSSGRSCRSGNSPTESAHRAGSPTAGSPALNTGKRKRRTSQGPELHASELLGVWEADESAEADVEKFFKGKSSSGVSKALLDNVSEESKTSSVLAYEYSRKSRIEKLRDWLQSNQYEMLMASVLLLNVLWMAFELQVHGSESGWLIGVSDEPLVRPEAMPMWDEVFFVGDMTFAGMFALDVSVRIVVLRLQFWTVWMNYIDVAVSATSLIEISLSHMLRLPVSPVLFRLLRIGKLARAIRMVTMSNVLASLQLLIKCLAASMNMLFWSFCLLTFVQCVFGMIVSTLCRDFVTDESYDHAWREGVFRYYGTFTRTFLTMFEILFANWSPPARVLVENYSEWFSIFFLIYRCVLGFAVLNVVNAVFVQQTMKTASSDEDLAFKQKEKDVAMYTRKVKKLFQTIDLSGDGTINLHEFAKLVQSPKLKFWMSQLELEYHDLMSLFEFLDNGDGEITLMEFIEGASRLRGGAKALDVWRLETKLEVLFEEVLSSLRSESTPLLNGDAEKAVAAAASNNVQLAFEKSKFRHIKSTADARRTQSEKSLQQDSEAQPTGPHF